MCFEGDQTYVVPPLKFGQHEENYLHLGNHGKVTLLKLYFGTGGICTNRFLLEAIYVEFEYGITRREWGFPGHCNKEIDILCHIRIDPGDFINRVVVTHWFGYLSRLEVYSNFGLLL